MWVYQVTDFYNISFKKWLKSNGVKTHSTQNEEKSVLPETFIRTWVNQIYKHMTAVSKNIYFDGLNNIVNKYNNIS